MGFKSVLIALALVVCLSMTVFAQGPKNLIVEPPFPGENMSGSGIYDEVQEGVYSDLNDSQLSFLNESLFIIRKDTGMSPKVPRDGMYNRIVLAISPAAGSWSFTLTDVDARYLKLNLYQTSDAVSGSGELMENGAITQVTAGGPVLGDQLALFVTPLGSQKLYRFSLTIKPGSMDGDYILTDSGITQPGIAFGSLISPSSMAASNQQTVQNQATNQVQQTTLTQLTQTLPLTT
jgi:hypothetical protein